jgi:hypothetical protein
MTHPAEQLLTALGKTRSTFQTFPDATSGGRPQILHGPHHAVTRRLERLNGEGHGIFHMVSHGDLQGRRAENVTAISAYFVDLDGAPMPDPWPVPPTAIVESSPGRYHAYWRVENAPLAAFERVQKHLALLMDGDDKVHDLPRVMRLPGYQHLKGEPFTSALLTCTDTRYEHEVFLDVIAIPDPEPVTAPQAPLPSAVRSYIDQRNRKPRARDPVEREADRVLQAVEGNRNDTLYRRACALANEVAAGKVSQSEAEARLKAAGLALGLPEHETARTIQSAMRHAHA